MNGMMHGRSTSLDGSTFGHDNSFVVTKKVSLKHRIFLSPFMKYVVPTAIAVILLMTGVYLTMYFLLDNTMDIWQSTCNIRKSYRIDCFPGRINVSYDQCNQADCCWHDETSFCFHSVPSRHGYTPKNDADTYEENEVFVPRRVTSPFGKKNAESFTLDIGKSSDPNHVEIIFKIGSKGRREGKNMEREGAKSADPVSTQRIFQKVPDSISEQLLDFLPKIPARTSINLQTDPTSNMDLYLHKPEFSVTLTRKDETSSLFSTARGPLILTDYFWELSLYVTNSSVYGLNQLELNGTTNWIYDNANATSRLAFLGINDEGKATSCYVDYKGPVEIKVMNESNLIILRGFSLPSEISVHVFAGPTPLEAIRQLTKSINEYDGKNDFMEPSNLGLHVCPDDDPKKYDYIDSLTKIIDALNKTNTPWDSHCIHRDFDPTLGNTFSDEEILIVRKAEELLSADSEGRNIIPHLSPMLFVDNNTLSSKLIDGSLLLKNSSTSYVGLYRRKSVFYPDWHDAKTHNESLPYLSEYIENFGNSTLVYLRDSWPMDQTGGLPVPDYPMFDYMPHALQSLMANETAPYNLVSPSRAQPHFTEHGSYSSDFRNFAVKRPKSTYLVIRGLRGESGNSSWSALRGEILSGVGSGIVGQLPSPMYACGTADKLGAGNDDDELCSRWFGASIAWPHVLALRSNLPGGEHLSTSSSSYVVKHLIFRASLSTYANTILAEYNKEGSPLLAPTSIYYPEDLQARNKWDQFMWGDGILVGLVTLPKVKQVHMWIPGKYPWRHLNGGAEAGPSKKEITSITAVESQIITLIRPGAIIPIHEKISRTTASTMKNDLTLVANLACDELNCTADGKIFYGYYASDGEFLRISTNRTILKVDNILKVQTIACKQDGMRIQRQGTVINNVVLLGFGEYKVNENLCNFTDDSVETPYDKSNE